MIETPLKHLQMIGHSPEFQRIPHTIDENGGIINQLTVSSSGRTRVAPVAARHHRAALLQWLQDQPGGR